MSEEEQEVIEKLKDNYILTTSEQNKLANLINRLQKELDKYKRLAEANLKDSQEFQDNMCNHRCIKNNEVLELKEELEKKDKVIDLMADKLSERSESHQIRIQTLLNLIDRLQKENEELEEKLDFEERSESFYQKKYFELKKENEELKEKLDFEERSETFYQKKYFELKKENEELKELNNAGIEKIRKLGYEIKIS